MDNSGAKDSLSSGLEAEDSSNELFISASFNSLFSDQDAQIEAGQSLQDLLTGAVVIPISQKIMLKISEDFQFNSVMMALTLLNVLLVCLELYSPVLIGWNYGVRVLDSMLLGVFTFEVGMRIWGWRWTFFRHWWLLFDFSIVLIGWLLPLGRTLIPQMSWQAYRILSVIRVTRLFRVFRTLKSLKAVESIQTILQTLSLSLPALLTIYILALMIGYFYSVISVFLFGTIDPQHFGNMGLSAKVYLQVSSLDLWAQIYFKSKNSAPTLFPVLVSYIIVQTFVLMNLLTAVIVDNLALLRKKLAKTKTRKTTKRSTTFISTVRSGDRKILETNMAEFGLGEYYSKDIPVRSQICMTTYFQNLVALEHSLHQLARQRKMIDEMVDLLKRQESLDAKKKNISFLLERAQRSKSTEKFPKLISNQQKFADMARTMQNGRGTERGANEIVSLQQEPGRIEQQEQEAPVAEQVHASGPATIPVAAYLNPNPQFTLEFQLFPHSDLPLHRQDSHNRPFVFAPVEKRISGPNGSIIQIGRKIDRAGKNGDPAAAALVGPRGTTREDRALHNVSTDPAHMSTGDKTGSTSRAPAAAPVIDALDVNVNGGGGGESNVEEQPVQPAVPVADLAAQPSEVIINTEPAVPAEGAGSTAIASSAQPPIECIAFRSKVVSRHHAEIFVGEDGQLYFRDVGSSSGSFLNRLRLSATGKASRPFPLKSGDVIQLGVDYQGRQEEIYKAVMIKIFINSKRSAPAQASKQRLNKALRSLLHAMNPNSKKEDEANTTVECCICINSMSPFQALFLAPCSHCFHYKCVTTLLGAGFMFQCPLCRQVANLEASVAEPDEIEAEYPQEELSDNAGNEPEDIEMETDAPPPPSATNIHQTLKKRSGGGGEKRSADDAMLGDEEDGGGAGPMSSDEELAGRLEMDVEEISGPSAPAASSFAPPFVNSIAVNIPGPSRSGHYNLDTSLVVSPSTPQNTSNHLTSNPTTTVSANPTAVGRGGGPSSRRGPDIPVQIFNTLTKLSDTLARGDEGGVERCMSEYAGQVRSLLRGLARQEDVGGEDDRQLVEQMIAALRQQSE